MLIGQTLRLSFGGYLIDALLPVGLGLIVSWALVVALSRGRWRLRVRPAVARARGDDADPFPPFSRWQSAKGSAVAAALFGAFLAAPWPRELLALAGAGLLLTSRRLHSYRTLGLVDWQLLVLFAGLFVVNHAFQTTGLPECAMGAFGGTGFELSSPWVLFGASFVLSNLVSNVPAVMLLLPVASQPVDGLVLALSSTLAGNLLVVSSIANIIVLRAADHRRIRLGWGSHARVGIPVTLATLAISATYLGVRLRLL